MKSLILRYRWSHQLLIILSIDAGAASLYWMVIEYNIGLVAGAMPGLRPLLSRIGILMSTKGDSKPTKNYAFAPSYRLENRDNAAWASSQRSGTKSGSRFQGDSILEATVLGDRNSDDSGRQQILKTQSISITEEARDDSSFVNIQQHHPWQEADRKV